MQGSLRLGRIHGVPVDVHWLFVLAVAWTAYQGWRGGGMRGLLFSTLLLLAAFACVLLHEAAHTIEARALGLPVQRIVLLPFGGLAMFAHLPERPQHELRIAAAGPLANLGLALVLGGLAGLWLSAAQPAVPPLLALRGLITSGARGGLYVLAYLALANAALTVFNLLPAFPLDGARILRSGLALLLPRATATQLVSGLGWLIGLGLVFGGLWLARQAGLGAGSGVLFMGVIALMGTSAEAAFQRGQNALRYILARSAVRQPTWYLAPSDPVSPVLGATLRVLEQAVLPVMDGPRMVGLVTREAFLAALKQPGPQTVRQIMQTDFRHVNANEDLLRAQQVLAGAPHGALPVLDGERLQGLLSFADIRAALLAPAPATGGEAPQFISAGQLGL